MREILFRGKRLDGGAWELGDLSHDYCKVGDTCISKCSGFVQVDPSTIGQYTGQLSAGGTKIFEGDIAVYDGNLVVIEWNEEDSMFQARELDRTNWTTDFSEIYGSDLHIIGNIHDNQELLEGGAGA